ncbi:unnamed protein product [Staurois parvus]|uniref:Uncharacterized protein n=1 Tax=Staurois parvus TaxID=386267 RepID=A0ABN9DD74_9NEOB|nr:unnamed protein product [Staurois parvus]
MQDTGRPDIVNAGSGKTSYFEFRVQETRYSEFRVLGDQLGDRGQSIVTP